MSKKTIKEMGWAEAIILILKEARGSLHYTEITDRILEQGLRKDIGATPASTVNANLSSDIKHHPDETLFSRTNPGEYCLKEFLEESKNVEALSTDERNEKTDLITSFGMYWRRDQIDFSKHGMLGFYAKNATKVNFWQQVGIYILYDNQRSIYVGKAIDRPIGQRLKEHTIDRLNGRWDRFSWFGVNPIAADGSLSKKTMPTIDVETLISTLESILIEAVEPSQNRKRGDQFYEYEYLQVMDKSDPLRENLKKLLENDLSK